MATSLAPAERASANFVANLAALQHTQPHLSETFASLSAGLEWILARDGSLTALDADGAWWAGCSLPWRAARSMFKSLKLDSLCGCFLSPGWSAQLRLCLDVTESRQAIVAVCPSTEALVVMLHCEPYEADIAGGRLWFATGPEWPSRINTIFDSQPGLAVPTQFIRAMSPHKDTIDAMIPTAQKALAEINTRRSAAVLQLLEQPSAPRANKPRSLCVVCPSQFSLWQDAGLALGEEIDNLGSAAANEIVRFDPDSPRSASSLALARSASECEAILIPDAGRADLPGRVPKNVACMTWVTRGGIPDAKSAGPRDRLFLADSSWGRLAIAAGWANEQISVAEWPTAPTPSMPTSSPPHLSLLADTLPGQAPAAVSDYSSHAALWEHIRRELLNDPFAVGDDAELFLSRLLRELDIAGEALDRRTFIAELIVPAYQQGLAMHLVRGGFPVKIFGRGWDAVSSRPECAILESAYAGPLASGADMHEAIAGAKGLVNAWPSRTAHPIYRYAKPVLGPSLSATAFAREASRILRADIAPMPAARPFSLKSALKMAAASSR